MCVCELCRTQVEPVGERSARFALHGRDGGDHGAAGHDGAVHLHPLTGGWGGRVPGPHLTGLQVGKLSERERRVIKNSMLTCKGMTRGERRTSVVSDPVAPSLVVSANVCCPLGCFFTRSKGTDTWPSKGSGEEEQTRFI